VREGVLELCVIDGHDGGSYNGAAVGYQLSALGES
jgi:hypothetical protein